MNKLALLVKNFEENLCNYEDIEMTDVTRCALGMIREGIETLDLEKILKSNIIQGAEDIVKVQRNLNFQVDNVTAECEKITREYSSIKMANDKLKNLE